MSLPPPPPEPPPIPGVRRSFVTVHGGSVHVTEAGEGTPVLALHGWPSHHYCYRDLLADPPAGLRIIAPDLPGYGWSGPASHRWEKEEIATDVLALLDALGVTEPVRLIGHDWGAFISYLLVLRAPERFHALLALSIPHPWVPPTTLLIQGWRLGHMPLMAAAGRPIVERTRFVEQVIYRLGVGDTPLPATDVRWFADRFRDPVCAQATTDTYRTFVTREVPAAVRSPERRRATVPIRALLGTRDFAIHPSLAAPETALADDYTLERAAGAGHFVPDERPALVRERLIALGGR